MLHVYNNSLSLVVNDNGRTLKAKHFYNKLLCLENVGSPCLTTLCLFHIYI